MYVLFDTGIVRDIEFAILSEFSGLAATCNRVQGWVCSVV